MGRLELDKKIKISTETACQINPISIINGEINKEELMFALSLKDSRNFHQRYLPAIANNLKLASKHNILIY
jgi:hypothetical protein